MPEGRAVRRIESPEPIVAHGRVPELPQAAAIDIAASRGEVGREAVGRDAVGHGAQARLQTAVRGPLGVLRAGWQDEAVPGQQRALRAAPWAFAARGPVVDRGLGLLRGSRGQPRLEGLQSGGGLR
eukprot:5372987-Pyramimonas_sp.AAC.1